MKSDTKISAFKVINVLVGLIVGCAAGLISFELSLAAIIIGITCIGLSSFICDYRHGDRLSLLISTRNKFGRRLNSSESRIFYVGVGILFGISLILSIQKWSAWYAF